VRSPTPVDTRGCFLSVNNWIIDVHGARYSRILAWTLYQEIDCHLEVSNRDYTQTPFTARDARPCAWNFKTVPCTCVRAHMHACLPILIVHFPAFISIPRAVKRKSEGFCGGGVGKEMWLCVRGREAAVSDPSESAPPLVSILLTHPISPHSVVDPQMAHRISTLKVRLP
jgi:hypothetical protein